MQIETLFPTLIAINQAAPETVAAIAQEVVEKQPLLESLLDAYSGDRDR